MSTFFLLNSSGVSIIKTLRLVAASAGNVLIESLYLQIADDVAHGTRISESMRDRDADGFFFSADILQMIESAEKTSTI
jgi:type II secretory pathway component PulF